MNINTLDLNLLKVFNALMQERNVTKAGEKVGLAQSSMSNALSRLRYTFDDELFVRTPKGMNPTSRADALYPMVLNVIEQAQTMLDVIKPFEPATATGTIRIATPDVVKVMLAPSIANYLQQHAPLLDVRFLPLDKSNVFERMDNDRVDLTLGTFDNIPKRFKSEPLYRDAFVCIARSGHPKLAKGMTIRKFADIPQVLVTLRDDNVGVVDKILAERGLKRRVAITVDQFTVMPRIVSETDYLALCPKSASELLCNGTTCVTFDLPFVSPTWEVSVIWGMGAEANPLIKWIRGALLEIAAAVCR